MNVFVHLRTFEQADVPLAVGMRLAFTIEKDRAARLRAARRPRWREPFDCVSP
jgi:hypothetical protein